MSFIKSSFEFNKILTAVNLALNVDLIIIKVANIIIDTNNSNKEYL